MFSTNLWIYQQAILVTITLRLYCIPFPDQCIVNQAQDGTTNKFG